MLKDPSNLGLKAYRNTFKNKLGNLIKKTKNVYYQNHINKNPENTKSLWNVVQEIRKSTIRV